MKILDNGERIQVRCKITGSYNGEFFVYLDVENSDGTQFIWTADNDPSKFWWEDGNMGCDCNRCSFLPEHLYEQFMEGKTLGQECGHTITLYTVEPLEGYNLPILVLDND